MHGKCRTSPAACRVEADLATGTLTLSYGALSGVVTRPAAKVAPLPARGTENVEFTETCAALDGVRINREARTPP